MLLGACWHNCGISSFPHFSISDSYTYAYLCEYCMFLHKSSMCERTCALEKNTVIICFFITILDLPPNPEGLERGMELRNLNPEVAENMENDTAGNRQLYCGHCGSIAYKIIAIKMKDLLRVCCSSQMVY